MIYSSQVRQQTAPSVHLRAVRGGGCYGALTCESVLVRMACATVFHLGPCLATSVFSVRSSCSTCGNERCHSYQHICTFLAPLIPPIIAGFAVATSEIIGTATAEP